MIDLRERKQGLRNFRVSIEDLKDNPEHYDITTIHKSIGGFDMIADLFICNNLPVGSQATKWKDPVSYFKWRKTAHPKYGQFGITIKTPFAKRIFENIKEYDIINPDVAFWHVTKTAIHQAFNKQAKYL